MAMNWQRAVLVGSSVSTTLAMLVGGGYLLGNYLDDRLGIQPLLTIILMLVGLVFGLFYLVVTLLKEFGK